LHRSINTTLLTFALLCACAPGADAGIFGSRPLNISVAPGGRLANGSSGEPAVSGDNRSVRIVAFSSRASNLVAGDSNGQRDIFIWRRPRGAFPRSLGRGTLRRVNVGRHGRQANGPSQSPSVDGSMTRRPHCVAFASRATNLSPHDALPDQDIYVRDLRRHRTILLSPGVAADAGAVSLAGNCRRAVFAAGGRVWLARVGSGRPHSLGRGSAPAFSRDGRSIVFVRRDGRVLFRHGGASALLSAGSQPRVSDRSVGHGWAVVYNHRGDVRLALVNRGRSSIRTAVRSAIVGGVSSRAAHRGIVIWARRGGLFYLNRHTGNSDDLAHARRPITEIASSARANLIAFTARGGRGFIEPRGSGQPAVYAKWLPK
jgi:hypothetical protein